MIVVPIFVLDLNYCIGEMIFFHVLSLDYDIFQWNILWDFPTMISSKRVMNTILLLLEA